MCRVMKKYSQQTYTIFEIVSNKLYTQWFLLSFDTHEGKQLELNCSGLAYTAELVILFFVFIICCRWIRFLLAGKYIMCDELRVASVKNEIWWAFAFRFSEIFAIKIFRFRMDYEYWYERHMSYAFLQKLRLTNIFWILRLGSNKYSGSERS